MFAAATNEVDVPLHEVVLLGFVVTCGALVTVRVAAVVVAVPQLFVKTARYCFALSVVATVKL